MLKYSQCFCKTYFNSFDDRHSGAVNRPRSGEDKYSYGEGCYKY